jgi:hypothetical protein
MSVSSAGKLLKKMKCQTTSTVNWIKVHLRRNFDVEPARFVGQLGADEDPFAGRWFFHDVNVNALACNKMIM